MFRILEQIAKWIGSGVLVLLALWLGLTLWRWWRRLRLPRRCIIELDLEKNYPESFPLQQLGRLFSGRQSVFFDLVQGLYQAADDKRVVACLAKAGHCRLGLAQVQEIREAIAYFRSKGKKAYVFAESFSEGSSGLLSYYLACAFDEIYIQPSGDLSLAGLSFEQFFLKGSFEKLKIQPQMGHREDYKTALNLFTESQYTPAHREQSESLLKAHLEQIRLGIAQDRGSSPAQVESWMEEGLFLGKKALSLKLIDGFSYQDEVWELAKKPWGKKVKLLPFVRYYQRSRKKRSGGKKIALVLGSGKIHSGKSTIDPLSGSTTIGSETFSQSFKEILQDDDIQAVVFRVDSPGGSAIASDTLWRQVVRAQKEEKPVIIWMGNVAASGGYYLAAPANQIIAQPGTITGSIGVVGGKFLTKGFWEALGLSFDEVHSGKHSRFWSSVEGFQEDDWKVLESWLDREYENFMGKVVSGRKMTSAQVRELAQGKVWMGTQAKKLGLVDDLGGFPLVRDALKKVLNLKNKDRLRFVLYPKPRSYWDQVSGRSEYESTSIEKFILLGRYLSSQVIQGFKEAVKASVSFK